MTHALTRSTRLAMALALLAGVVVPLGLSARADAATGTFLAGAAEAPLDIPVGVPLGGYLRPPVGGDLLPALEAMSGGNPTPVLEEILDFTPVDQDDPTQPQAPVPDEARGLTSPWTTFMPPSRGYYETLLSKAIAMSDGDDTMVIVKADVIGSLDELRMEVARRVEDEVGVDLRDGLVITATHTHDGPGALATNSTRYFFLAMDAFQPEIYDRVAQQMADLVVDALDAMVPARMGWATGQESHVDSLNSFRRSRSPWDADRVVEQEALRRRMGVVRFDEVDDSGDVVRPIATIINYSAHGIMFGVENLFFSGDALGSAERAFEDSFDTPVVAMFVQSAVGDVSPRADGRPTLQRIERFGRLLAPQLRDLHDGIGEFQTDPDVEVRAKRFRLNRDVLGYTGLEYPHPFGAVQCNGAFNQEECLSAPPPDAHDLLDGDAENATFVPMDTIVTGARIGDLLLIGQPGEAVTEHGLRVIEASPFPAEDTFIVGLAQDHVGYILPDSKEDWLLGGTEGTTTFWGWKQGARILDVSVEVMNALAGLGPDPVDELAVSYTTTPYASIPATPSAAPGAVVSDTDDIRRLEATSFVFEGGDPVLGTPTITVQHLVDGSWTAVTERGGRPMDTLFAAHLTYTQVNAQHHWQVDFEAPYDWPVGTYRLVADGVALGASGEADFQVASASFEVTPTDTLLLGPVTRDGDLVSTTFAYPTIEENYRIIDPLVRAERNAPVRGGCVLFADGTTEVVADAPVMNTVDGLPVATWTATLPGTGEVTASGADAFGNIAVSDDCLPDEPEPTDPPTEPTVEPTDPEPSETEPTDPEPTDPEPSESEPTEPQASEAELVRIEGGDRYATAAAVAAATFPGGADTVFVATGQDFPDALAAGPVAAREGAPIVLVRRDSVPSATTDVLRRLDPDRIVVVGGPQAVGAGALADLRAIAEVTVVAGDSRYDTAALMAQRGFPDGADTVHVATGRSFPDALAGAALAGREGTPVLLVEADGVPDAVARELARLAPEQVVVLGGEAAVSEAAETRLAAASGAGVSRVQGTTRYATAAAVAATFASPAEVVYLATGEDFPDALAGTPAAIRDGAPILLTAPRALLAEARDALERLSPRRIVVLGGERAVGAETASAASAFLRRG